MLGMQGQPARTDSFLSSLFPDGRGFGSAWTGTICRRSSVGKSVSQIMKMSQVQVLPSVPK